MTARGMGWVEFSLIPQYRAKNHPDAFAINAENWVAKLSLRTYAIDNETAIAVVDGDVEVISEGQWKLVRLA